MSDCPACAEEVADGDERCRWCGERLQDGEDPTPTGYGRDSLLVAVVCVVATIVLIGWLLVL